MDMVEWDQESDFFGYLQDTIDSELFDDLVGNEQMAEFRPTMIITTDAMVYAIEWNKDLSAFRQMQMLKELIAKEMEDGLSLQDVAYVFIDKKQVDLKIDVQFSAHVDDNKLAGIDK